MVRRGTPPEPGDEPIGEERLARLMGGMEQLFADTTASMVPDLVVDTSIETLRSIQDVLTRIRAQERDISLRGIHEIMTDAHLSDGVRTQIARICPELEVRPYHVRRRHMEIAARSLDTKHSHGMGGERFLSDMLEHGALGELGFSQSNRLIDLTAKTSSVAYPGAMQMLYTLLDGDVDELCRIVSAQTEGGKTTPMMEHMPRLINVYSDVTQTLIDNNRTNEPIGKNAVDFLKRLFSDPRWQLRDTSLELQPFSYMQQLMREGEPSSNPWRYGALSGTPFDKTKVPELVTRDIPREELAAVLLDINDFAYRTGVRNARELVDKYDRLGPKCNKECDELIPIIAPDVPLDEAVDVKIEIFRRRFIELPAELKMLFEQNQDVIDGLPDSPDEPKNALFDKIDELIDAYQIPVVQPRRTVELVRELRGAYTSLDTYYGEATNAKTHPLLLRLLSPEKIARDMKSQKQFVRLVSDLESDRSVDRKVLQSSIEVALRDQSSFLDVPLPALRNDSIRDVLVRLVIVHNLDHTIVPMVAAEGLDKSAGPIEKDFDVAAVGRVVKPWMDAAAAMVASLARLPGRERFKRIVGFTTEEAGKYFNGTTVYKDKEVDKARSYDFFCYENANGAFRDIMRYLVTNWNLSNFVVTDQEYGLLTEQYLKLITMDVGGSPIREIPLNDRVEGRIYTVDEMFEKISGQIHEIRTKLILISSRTRYGDAPCSDRSTPMGGRKTKPNTYYLGQLIKKLKAAFPGTPILVDGCQSIGRSYPPDDLKELGADMYIANGTKALGVRSSAVMGITQKFQESIKFKYDTATLDEQNIAALGIGIHRLRSTADYFRPEGNGPEFGRNRNRLDLKIGFHMARLTEHIIKHAEEYGRDFTDNYLPQAAPEFHGQHLEDSDRLKNQFGCEVVYPIHGHPKDYTGIVTLAFPNLRATQFVQLMNERGYRFTTCLEGDRAMRISCHYLHELHDIDELFRNLKEVHAHIVKLEA
ncbi:hypothetical protein KBD59_06035, partial [Candidatus Gracilibacteria bacterium]|nr:hypothetical protein [Candidatus Gracilibacteria bacterium]